MTSTDINIVKPPTVWISKRCYRVLIPGSANSVNVAEDDAYPEDDVYNDDVDCGHEFDIPVEQMSNGKARSSFAVASMYLPYLIGARGMTKRRIENETYTQIKIPSKGQVGDVVVIGRDVKTVRQARLKLELLVNQAKKKQPFTHFISIPFVESSIQERFVEFKKEVLEKYGNDRGIDSSIFQSPKKLHLTLCVLILADERERHEAVVTIEKCHKEIMEQYICGETLRVEMRGIEYMNDDPGEVDVLYGKVNTSSWTQSLQDVVDAIVEKLVRSGVARKQHDRVKLHITLMNTLFRNDQDGTDDVGQSVKERETFDARHILQEFKDYYFGETEVSELHLSVRYSTSSVGYYMPSCKFSLLGSN